jgi:hypothetical protein
VGVKEWLNSDSIIKDVKDIFTPKDKSIQATSEFSEDPVDLENALYINNVNRGIGGTKNNYITYQTQVEATYKKYNGEATWGNQQTRAVLDIRSAFISGEGLSLVSTDDSFIAWYKKFISKNRILGSRFFDAVLGTEITGKALFTIKPRPGDYPKVLRVPYMAGSYYKVVLEDKYDPDSISDVTVAVAGVQKSLGLDNFIYIRTGGDDRDVNKTPTRVGVILNEADNYDRANKDLRLTNHVVSRITPTFETETEKQTREVADGLKKTGWRIGKAFVGTAKFAYKTPGTGSVDNLKSEMATDIKTIAGVTGVPVHWIGWTDLMANRSTADSLYATLKNATVRERSIIEDSIYELIIKAQEIYIDSGGRDIKTINRDFSVQIPIVDMSNFKDTVEAMHIAFLDGVVSKGDYQNALPGVDPLKTEEALKKEGQSGKVVEQSNPPPVVEDNIDGEGDNNDK